MSYRNPFVPARTASLVVAVLFPALVIAIEFATGICADAFFDPMPTLGHLLLVAAVPGVNFLLWRAAGREDGGPAWLLVAGGAGIAIAISYALLFLPMLPFALIAILLLGIGLLPFAPLAALVCAWRWIAELSVCHAHAWRRVSAGVSIGIVALSIVDLPATATQIALARYAGDDAEQASAVGLMRRLGDRELLLRLSYGDAARATGIASLLVTVWSDGPFGNTLPPTAPARELYYRVTGTAFNVAPRPGHGPADRMRWSGWDEDQGGEAVGGRVEGLTLAGSRIDGSVAGRDNLAYLEWTIDLANAQPVVREGRFTLALPEGAVASRATLWVNGEPREASIARRATARAAYTSVVRASRDPLLVTTDGAQRLLVQAFPIPANASLRLRIGITAPFAIGADGARSLALPAIVERNFDIPDTVTHAVWIDGDQPIGGAAHGSIRDADLLARRPVVTLLRAAAPWSVVGGSPASGTAPALAVEQRVARVAARPAPLMIVVDAATDTAQAAAALPSALNGVAPGVPVGLAIAGDAVTLVDPRPWSPDQASRIRTALAQARFVGGADSRAALARAVAAMPDRDATLLWVHGAQPVRFARPEPALEQVLDRSAALPRLIRYQTVPGRAMTVADHGWFDTARMPRASGDPVADLRAIVADAAGAAPRWQVARGMASAPATGSEHIVRLWAADRLTAASGERGKARDASIDLAHRLNIVTPVSGAVVLETDKDYRANGLPVPDADAVPTVPEPETWALLICVAFAAAWMLHRRRRAEAWA
ncbi:PEP-CTERM sorting domain-containing protein [Sphingomonas donggukensis]|uniref:PEP-CTERM sorting domain-containing protein n=1 Tax=Sphingomonas donggukensis TaxID=2949093 RepID=A0ABY4U094_9SPHN|nr:VIT domain-containing protein [Sphingomonas donggukensis]URW76191.1 PEP-CTERM sorting domain-containing protein [Sphingomonas donggukensis]